MTVTVHSFLLMCSRFVLYKAATTAKPESFRLVFTMDIMQGGKKVTGSPVTYFISLVIYYTNPYLKVRLPKDNKVILQSLCCQAHSKLLKKLKDF